jgi:hypothetical protein
MRALWIGIAATMLMSVPALANDVRTVQGRIVSYANTDMGGLDVPTVMRGAQFAIACDGVDAPGADVRVVMALAPSEPSTGYTAVMATNQHIDGHSVQVQVPNVPDIANHTVSVKVYVTDAKGTKACDAGRVHIV